MIRCFEFGELGMRSVADALFLGRMRYGGSARFALALTEGESSAMCGLQHCLVDLRATGGTMHPDEVSLLGNAKALAEWHASHGYCGRCGTATVIAEAGWRRKCPSCGQQSFPRTDPVVIMAASDGDRLVLARQTHFPEGMYSLPAGFVEPGEDIEHAVRRETKEELALDVGVVRYAVSQPWPFPHTLMIGCFADVPPDPVTADPEELEDARWFDRPEVMAMQEKRHPAALWFPGRQAIANALIRRWLAEA